MTRRRIKIIVSLMAVIVVAVFIFGFSSQEGQKSGRLSRKVTEWLLDRFLPGFGEMPKAERMRNIRHLEFYVRKTAHFSEYALLALTLVIYLHYILEGRRPSTMALIAWILSSLYACTDELHQMFVKSRGPAIADVGIDSAGAILGALFGMALVMLRLKYKRKRDGLA